MPIDNSFMHTILPDSGYYCLLAYKNGKPKQSFYSTIEAHTKRAAYYSDNGYDTYFGMSAFQTDQNRKQSNAEQTQSFFLDIDVGKSDGDGSPVGYQTKREALTALHNFCSTLSLPKPSIVDSGYGYHVYWPLTEPLPVRKWTELALRFKAACLKFDLHIDRAVPADSARVLRVPGTFNFKDTEHPRKVKIIFNCAPIESIDFIAPIQALNLPELLPKLTRKPQPTDPLTAALAGNITHNFAAIAKKSVHDTGCAQIKYILHNAKTLSEPLWRAGLSIAACCTDRDTAIHKMSWKHPEYDPEETQTKADATNGPYRCETFKDLNPDTCKGCKQNFTSPVMVDSNLKIAEPFTKEEIEEERRSEPEKSKPKFEPPSNYELGKNGGIYFMELQNDGSRKPKLVYKYPLQIVQRLWDEIDKECAVVRLHLPCDAARDFTVPLRDLLKLDKGTAALRDNGVITTAKAYPGILEYMSKSLEMLQELRKAQAACLQYGWNRTDTTFVVGRKEFWKGEASTINYPSSTTGTTIDALRTEGSYDVWREAVDVYHNSDLEPQKTVFFASFGAPLMNFTGEKGSVINLISTDTATGKTTALRAALSVWGDPHELMMRYNDTYNARMHRTGVMKNLFLGMDELTNLDGDLVSNLLYSISMGKDKARLEASSNRERVNRSAWATIVATTSNASMSDKIGVLKSTPAGELARLLEFNVKTTSIPGASVKFDAFDTNFGWVGPKYSQWLVDNAQDLPAMVERCRQRILRLSHISNKGRFWVSTVACALVGGRIAYELGLHDLDMDYQEKWLIDHFAITKKQIEHHTLSYDEVITDYIMDNVNSMVSIDADQLCNLTGTQVWRAPSNNKLRIRIEVDKHKLWLHKASFDAFCAAKQLTIQAVLDAANGKDSSYTLLADHRSKRMFANTGLVIPAVGAYEFFIMPGTEIETLTGNNDE